MSERPLISVVMASRLEDYPHCADNREARFIAAVNSFIRQTPCKGNRSAVELVIVADGCARTEAIHSALFCGREEIRLESVDHSGYFSGKPRQRGIEASRGEFICYLDSDDLLMPHHLSSLLSFFCLVPGEDKWCYFDDHFYAQKRKKMHVFKKRIVKIDPPMRIGTCSICHSRDLPVVWPDGYGHDHAFIEQLKRWPYRRVPAGGYLVCHKPEMGEAYPIGEPYLLEP